MAEQLICNQQVDGSTPFTSSNYNIYGGIPERPKGADCKSVVTDFAGPNPASPTIKKHRPCVGVFFMARIACDPEQALASQVRWFAFEPKGVSSLLVNAMAKNTRSGRVPSFPHQKIMQNV